MEIAAIIAECIRSQRPVLFAKYGDGEYNCILGHRGCNCDQDSYTDRKRQLLIDSFQLMHQLPNSYIGMWHTPENMKVWQGLVPTPVRWANYHSLLLEAYSPEKIDLYRAIKETDMKKIYLCNRLLVKAQPLFGIDHMVYVPFNNWFDDMYAAIVEKLVALLKSGDKYIVMTSAGMGAKVILALVAQQFPDNIYLDFGSALDKICTQQRSRGWEPDYATSIEWLKDIIPDSWNDASYDPIYLEAKTTLGQHLR
jgi:hypothetical protein